MNKFRTQRYQTTVTIPVNNDTEDAPVVSQLNGMLKGITVEAPALTGTSFILTILGQRGETLFSKSAIVEAVLTHINTKTIGAAEYPLDTPISLRGVSPLRIKSSGTPDATGTLTFSNNGAFADGDTVTIGDQVYRAKLALAAANDFLIEPDVKAQGLIDSGATGPLTTETITIGVKTYRFIAVLAQANDVLLEADVDDTLQNLKDAINGGAGEGTKYGTGTTANADAEATTLNSTDHTLLIQALVAGPSGNSIVFTEAATDLVVNGAGTLGTTQAGAWSGDDTLQNLSDAIELEDGGGESGVKYHAGTAENAYVTAADVASHAIIVTAKDAVDDPTDVDTLESSARLSWGAATLVGGGEAAQRVFNVDLLIDRG